MPRNKNIQIARGGNARANDKRVWPKGQAPGFHPGNAGSSPVARSIQRSALEQGVEVVTPGRTQGDTHEGVARAEVVPNAGTGPAGARPYISAARYAALLGCTRDAVIEDVKRGMAGALGTITGGRAGEWIVVEGWETADERLDLHRKRLGLSPATSANEGLKP